MKAKVSISIALMSIECWLTFVDLNDTIQRFDNVDKSPFDKRSYRGLILPNKMKVMLISDPSTAKAAASLVVGVGSLQDFRNIDGLANLLACALRRRSVKYSEPNNYEHFIHSYDGSAYLQTHDDHQLFAFEIDADQLVPALDRFAQFFRRPTLADLTYEDLDDAVDIVENDFEMRKNNDDDRIQAVEKLLSRPNHEYKHFSHGNKQTLYHSSNKATLLSALKTFYTQFYSSNVMDLVVLGKESLTTLESLVVSLFGRVVNRNVPLCEFKGARHPWGPEELGRKVYIVPKDEKLQVLRITFPVPDVLAEYDMAVYHFIYDQLLYVGPGGLGSILKKRNLCSNIEAQHREPAGIGFLRIMCDLTDEGVTRVDEVVDLIFQYLAMVSDEGLSDYLFEDLKKMNAPRFSFQSNFYKRSINFTRLIALALKYYRVPMNRIIMVVQGEEVVRKEDWIQIKMLLCYLKPDYMNITIVSKVFEGMTDQTEAHYEVPYKIERIPDVQINEWYEEKPCREFRLPPPNKFLPNHAKLYSLDRVAQEYPYLIHKASSMQVWFKQDQEFRVPWQHVWIEIRMPRSSWNPFLFSVWCIYWAYQNRFVEEHLSSAHDAGFEAIYKPEDFAIDIHIYGHSETMLLYLQEFLSKTRTLHVDMDVGRFKEAKSVYIERRGRYLKNVDDLKSRSLWYADLFLQEYTWPVETLLALAATVQMEDVKVLSRKLFSRVYVQSLVYGNYNRKKAKEVVNLFQNSFPPRRELLPQELLQPRRVQAEAGSHYIYRIFKRGQIRNSYVTFLLINQKLSTMDEVTFLLVQQIIVSLCESKLKLNLRRVQCSLLTDPHLDGLIIMTESKTTPRIVDAFVKQFLVASFNTLKEMPVGELMHHKDKLRKKVFLKPAQLYSSDQYWDEILNQYHEFGRLEEGAKLLRSVKKSHLVTFFKVENCRDSDDTELKLMVTCTMCSSAYHEIQEKEYFLNRRSELTILEFPEGTESSVTDDLPSGVRKVVKIEDFLDFRNSNTLLPY